MQVPLELSFDEVPDNPQIRQRVERKVAHLEKICDRITACRVRLEKPHQHASSGNPYRIRIEVSVPPGNRLVVDKGPRDHDLNDTLQTVITNAFAAAERQVKELVERQRRDVKSHDEPRALVVRLFEPEDEDDYGFIKTPEGREIYFHRNAVADDAFDRLAVGTEVRFEEAMGRAGPQATTVQIVGKPGERPTGETGEEGVETPAGWEA